MIPGLCSCAKFSIVSPKKHTNMASQVHPFSNQEGMQSFTEQQQQQVYFLLVVYLMRQSYENPHYQEQCTCVYLLIADLLLNKIGYIGIQSINANCAWWQHGLFRECFTFGLPASLKTGIGQIDLLASQMHVSFSLSSIAMMISIV